MTVTVSHCIPCWNLAGSDAIVAYLWRSLVARNHIKQSVLVSGCQHNFFILGELLFKTKHRTQDDDTCYVCIYNLWIVGWLSMLFITMIINEQTKYWSSLFSFCADVARGSSVSNKKLQKSSTLLWNCWATYYWKVCKSLCAIEFLWWQFCLKTSTDRPYEIYA